VVNDLRNRTRGIAYNYPAVVVEPQMTILPTYIYDALLSDDRLTLVQVFRDFETGLILEAAVCKRDEPHSSWGPPIRTRQVD
jgi:hypothetical protein